MSEVYFKADQLCVGYNKHAIINNINLEINKGEIIALIGPNGAGKSTILKSIAKELEIINGSIYLEGKDMKEYTFKDLSKKMAVVLTDRLKLELMTCHEVVATGRYPYTGRLGILSKEDEKIVDEALETVHGIELGPKDFNAISDGQRQRVLLARALCQQPEIILLDEPTSFLDVRYKLELLSILARMARKNNITVIMSLHEIDLAEKVADKIVCIKGDQLFDYGEPEKVFNDEIIRNLYEIDKGSFNSLFGSIELQKPHGDKPKVFVLSGGGLGIPIYRRLQRDNIPFVAGILAENDMDTIVAEKLAISTITYNAFEELTDNEINDAIAFIEQCDFVLDPGVVIGKSNQKISKIISFAKEKGKYISDSSLIK